MNHGDDKNGSDESDGSGNDDKCSNNEKSQNVSVVSIVFRITLATGETKQSSPKRVKLVRKYYHVLSVRHCRHVLQNLVLPLATV